MKGRPTGKPWTTRFALVLALAGLLPLAHAVYMTAKAHLAQVLLERAWQHARLDGGASKPWPWADTTPVARLHFARLGIDQIVLSGDSGRTLAFGPGWMPSSARPGGHGLTVISAHRDTHFSFLRKVVRGDEFAMETAHRTSLYRVIGAQVIDSRTAVTSTPMQADGVLLVTCYPFEAIVPGGPLRYVVSAVADQRAMNWPQDVSASSSSAHDDALATR